MSLGKPSIGLLALFAAVGVMAANTEIMVRVVSQDAKLIGSGVGGAWVTVTEAQTGRLLAQGEHVGETGSTDLIMRLEPQTRDSLRFDTEGAAGFLAAFDIDQPTRVRITAVGPLGNPHASMRASTEMLLTPGARVHGDGVVLTLHGFNIEIREPATGRASADSPLRVLAEIGMMCGCPLEPGGLWDADTVKVEARLLSDTEAVAVVPLTYAGKSSHFAGEIPVPVPGVYVLEILAAQPGKANFGRARTAIAIGR